MQVGGAFAPAVRRSWGQRHNVLPGLALAALATAGWAYLAYHTGSTSMNGDGIGAGTLFMTGWTAMMTAMMVPATLPLILLYRTMARRQLSPSQSRIGMLVLLAGYLAVWAAAGMPVYAYSLLAAAAGSLAAALPASLLVVGGIYQFTPLKRICHARCASPIFFLLQNWRQGPAGALRLGMAHGIDCLGCCAGLMASLVGSRDDEPGLDAYGRGRDIRREDHSRQPPPRPAPERPDDRRRRSAAGCIPARWGGTRLKPM